MQRSPSASVWRPMAAVQATGSSEYEWTSGASADPANESDLSATCSCRLERVEEDVLVVSVQRDDGCLFRGALIKVKAWPCPDIPPLAPEPASSAPVLPEEGGPAPTFLKEAPALPEGSTPEAAVPLNGLVETDVGGPVDAPAPDASPGPQDFAALQHRWSYFQKNLPPLPKKNIQSKREKEKLEQVPKLRPRNFLCTRCKFALPGFTQPQTPVDPADTDPNPLVPSLMAKPLSPSHVRKRKPPVKRTITRPAYLTDAYPPTTPDSPVVTAPATEPVPEHRKPGHRKRHNKEDPTVATILSSPTSSGESGLKIKFKLGAPAPVEMPVANKPKRSKRPKAALEEDEDEFMWPPKLRIDDAPDEAEGKTSPEVAGDVAPEAAEELPRPTVHMGMTPKVPRRRGRPPAVETEMEVAVSPAPVKPPEPKKARTRDAVMVPSEPDADPNLPKARSVESCVTKDGRTFHVGDVVWGKLTGYPWWPGKINHIIVCDDPMLQSTASSAVLTDPRSPSVLQYQEAQIEWYGQKSSISYIEVMQLAHYAEDFDKKHKPKERAGGYPEAIKAANQAAHRHHRPAEASPARGRGRGKGAGRRQRPRPEEEDPEEPDILSELARATLERERAQEPVAEPRDAYHFEGMPSGSAPRGGRGRHEAMDHSGDHRRGPSPCSRWASGAGIVAPGTFRGSRGTRRPGRVGPASTAIAVRRAPGGRSPEYGVAEGGA